MAQDKVTFRYAKAIFDYLKSADNVRQLAIELNDFKSTIDSHIELKQVVTTASYSEEERRNVVMDVVAKLKLSEEAKRILTVLSDGKRLTHVGSIAERLNLLVLDYANVVPLQVETATALEAEEKKKLESKFKTVLGKDVEASYQVEPGLLGGLKVMAGGKTYDGSILGWLGNFQENLERP